MVVALLSGLIDASQTGIVIERNGSQLCGSTHASLVKQSESIAQEDVELPALWSGSISS